MLRGDGTLFYEVAQATIGTHLLTTSTQNENPSSMLQQASTMKIGNVKKMRFQLIKRICDILCNTKCFGVDLEALARTHAVQAWCPNLGHNALKIDSCACVVVN